MSAKARAEERTPVLVGVAQIVERDQDPSEAAGPLTLLERVARKAAEDAGLGEAALARLDRIAVPALLSWRIRNPAGCLAARLGVTPREEITTTVGGNMPQRLVNEAARDIRRGACEWVLVAGAEAQASVERARRSGIELSWPTSQERERQVVGDRRPGSSDLELAHGLALPAQVYPVFENALRARLGLDLEAHRAQLGRLSARLSETAAANPYAWFQKQRSPEEIAQPSAENRMIAFPYTKLMNAFPAVDQAAALLLTSAEAARAHGIPEERLVYWCGGADAIADPWFWSERAELDASPALGRTARAALAEAGVDVARIDAFDLYSCFPVAVEIACREIGLALDDPRPPSITGGLPYAGGPWNNYTTHAIATLVERLRRSPGSTGLVTALGWYLTRHSAAVYASAPPAEVRTARAPEVRETGERPGRAVELALEPRGPGRIESYTVLYARDGAPERGIVVGRLEDGRRFLAETPPDRALLEALVREEAVGRPGRVEPGQPVNRFHPR